jgi:hypothetical protein
LLLAVAVLPAPGAAQCANDGECNEGFICDDGAKCADCSRNEPLCQNCLVDDNGDFRCLECPALLTYLSLDGHCRSVYAIDQYAANVTLVNGEPQIQCQDYYYRASASNQTCAPCWQVVENAQQCAADDAGNVFIVSCYDGYALSADRKNCTYCNITGAATCHFVGSQAVVDSCWQGYYFDVAGG